METLSRMPFAAQKAIFDRLGNLAMIEALPEKDRNDYEESLRVYRDSITVYEDAREIGFEEGREKGRKEGIQQGMEKGRREGIQQGMEKGMEKGSKNKALEVATNMKKFGMDNASICQLTGLTPEEVAKL